MANLSGGYQDGERSSSAYDQPAVMATPAASTARAGHSARRRQRLTAPIPTRAAIAGASATV